MKQEEKKQLSKEKILNAAIAEFGTKSYENASLNNICSDTPVSKGLIYHYFKSKDQLYLCCIKSCLDALTEFMAQGDYVFTDFQKSINHYLDLRYEFFKENPYYSNIFFNIVLQPPVHLKNQIKELRQELDTQAVQYYKKVLAHIKLRENITEEEAVEFFFVFQEMFNGYFQSKAYESSDFNSLIEVHEINLPKILNIMLYGITQSDQTQEETQHDTFNR